MRRVASVPTIVPNHSEGAPGLQVLETWDGTPLNLQSPPQKYFSKLWKSFAGNYGHLCHAHNQKSKGPIPQESGCRIFVQCKKENSKSTRFCGPVVLWPGDRKFSFGVSPSDSVVL
jgi:hypothetical protein